MSKRLVQYITLFLVTIVIAGLCSIDVDAQKRRRRRARRVARPVITNPTINAPTTDQTQGEGIISTGDETSGAAAELKGDQTKSPNDPAQMQDTITSLSNQVTKLTEKLGEMQEEQRTLLDMERLTRAEQRAEMLRSQLRDVQEKQADLQSRLEQTEYALRPESIERMVAVYGTTRPEEAREARRRGLESERTRIKNQLDTLETSRQRLETAIATADREVELLRERIDKNNQQPVQTVTTVDTTVTPAEESRPKNPYPPR